MRVAILGFGHMGTTHRKTLDELPGATVVAVADNDAEKQRLARRLAPEQVNTFDTWEALLEWGEFDALFVCTPPTDHAGPTVAAMGAGIHVYLEKPLARSLHEAETIVAAQPDGVVGAVGYQWRAIPFLDDIRAELDATPLGMLVGRSIGAGVSRNWFADWSVGGGILYELASHDIDLQRALGGEIVAVQAAASTPPIADVSVAGFRSVLALSLLFESGALGSVSVACARPHLEPTWALDVVAADAMLHVALDPIFRLEGVSRGEPLRGEMDRLPVELSVRRFIEAVQLQVPSRVACDLREGLKTLVVVDACERSLATGQRVVVGAEAPR